VVDEPDMNIIHPLVGVGFDVMAAAVIAAVDQHIADAGGAHLAEGDFFPGWSSWPAVGTGPFRPLVQLGNL
jgi:hypothetical protein